MLVVNGEAGCNYAGKLGGQNASSHGQGFLWARWLQ